MSRNLVKSQHWPNPPTRVGVISTPVGLRYLEQKKLPVELCEVRVDCLRAKGLSLSSLIKHLKNRKQQLLLTARSSKEGGVYKWKPGEREISIILLAPYIDWIDLELAEIDKLKLVYNLVKKLKKKVVLSTHFFKSPPDQQEIQKLITRFQRHNAHCYKIAAKLNKPVDLHNLASILRNQPKNNWAIMGMGNEARRSRVVLSLLGSRLMYGYLDKPTAPGQPSIGEINALLEQIS